MICEVYLNLFWMFDKVIFFIGIYDEVVYDQFVLFVNKGYCVLEIKLVDKVKIDIDFVIGVLCFYIYKGKEMFLFFVVFSFYCFVMDNDSREKIGGVKVWRKEGLDNMI